VSSPVVGETWFRTALFVAELATSTSIVTLTTVDKPALSVTRTVAVYAALVMKMPTARILEASVTTKGALRPTAPVVALATTGFAAPERSGAVPSVKAPPYAASSVKLSVTGGALILVAERGCVHAGLVDDAAAAEVSDKVRSCARDD
jgi:hypothetical protein